MTTLFVLELAAIIIIFYFLLGSSFTDNLTRILTACSVSCIYFVLLYFNVLPMPFTFPLIVIVSLLFHEKIYYTISLLVICTLFEMVTGYSCIIVIYMLTKVADRTVFFLTTRLDCCLYALAILFSILMRKKRTKHARVLHEIDAGSYLFLCTVTVLSASFLTLTETFLYSEINKISYYFTALSFITAIIVLLLVISVIAVLLRQYNLKLQYTNHLKQMCLELERTNYYETRQRDEEIRAFRHDFKNHILALQGLAESKQWNKLNNYIHQLSIDKNSFSLYNISTGNVTADAITNHFRHSLEDDTVFKINGQFQKECFVEDMDICIIFSNLLNNAREAFEYIEKNRTKEIYLSITAASDETVFMLENTSKAYTDKELEHLQTIKTDRINHGFGLMNVRRVSEKYHGRMLLKFSDGFFITTVILYNR